MDIRTVTTNAGKGEVITFFFFFLESRILVLSVSKDSLKLWYLYSRISNLSNREFVKYKTKLRPAIDACDMH